MRDDLLLSIYCCLADDVWFINIWTLRGGLLIVLLFTCFELKRRSQICWNPALLNIAWQEVDDDKYKFKIHLIKINVKKEIIIVNFIEIFIFQSK